MVQVIYVTVNDTTLIDVDFGIHASYEKSIRGVLKGDVTIVGAQPELNLVVIGNKEEQFTEQENTNTYLKDFNKDVINGNVIVMKTNDKGEPIDV